MIMQALLSIMAVMLLLQASPAEQAVVPTRVMPLFNGRDLTGWKADVPEKDTNPSAPDSFIVRNGMLVSLGTPGGHLLTEKAYRNYRPEAEYRFAGKPGNTGVLRHGWPLRPRYRMLQRPLEARLS